MKTPISTMDLNQFIAVKFITKVSVGQSNFGTNNPQQYASMLRRGQFNTF